jgi:hypothetical protein
VLSIWRVSAFTDTVRVRVFSLFVTPASLTRLYVYTGFVFALREDL